MQIQSRMWHFTHVIVSRSHALTMASIEPAADEQLTTLEQALRELLDDIAGVTLSMKFHYAVFEFGGGISEAMRRRILPAFAEHLPPDALLSWRGTCVVTTTHLGGWSESVADMDPHRTRE